MKQQDSTSGICDLKKNSFVQTLNRHGSSPDYGDLIFPTDKEINKVAKAGRELLVESRKKAKKLEESTGGSDSLKARIERLSRQQNNLRSELEKAFGIEKPAIEESLKKVASQLEALHKSVRKISKAKNSGTKATSSADTLRKKFELLLKDFPGAQLLDLSAITSFKNKQGLPAVALFGLDTPHVGITLSLTNNSRLYSKFGWEENNILDESKHSIFFERLTNQVALATGVYCSRKNIRKNKNLAKQARQAKDEGWLKELPTLSAGRIVLETQFQTSKGVFPKEARELIGKAKESKKFRDVFLLAEVSHWDLTYYNLEGQGSPIIEGKIVNTPKSKNPLIVAPAVIGKREYWFVLGAFDTTAVEDLIHAEYSTNPRV